VKLLAVKINGIINLSLLMHHSEGFPWISATWFNPWERCFEEV